MEEDSTLISRRRGRLEPLLSSAVEGQQRCAAEIVRLVAQEWRECPSGPQRAHLSLTDDSRALLSTYRDYWRSLTETPETIGRPW